MARGDSLLVMAASLTIAPWTARNWAAYGRPVLVASEGGITFWTGNHPLAVGDGDLAANPAIKHVEPRCCAPGIRASRRSRWSRCTTARRSSGSRAILSTGRP